MPTTTASDFAQLTKEYVLPNQKISLWDQFLTGQQTYYQGLGQQAQDVYAYDISQAYSNYKKQQLQYQMSEQLGSGFKEQISSELLADYESAYGDIKAKETSALSDIDQAYQKALAEGEAQFAQYGEYAKQLETYLLDYARENTNMFDYDVTRDDVLYKQTGVDEYGNITYETTDYYSDMIDKILHGAGSGFEDYLKINDEELYDIYLKNQDLYNAVVGGLEYGDRSYNPEEYLYKARLNDILSGENKEFLTKEFDADKYTTNEEKLKTVNELLALQKTEQNVNKSVNSYQKEIKNQLQMIKTYRDWGYADVRGAKETSYSKYSKELEQLSNKTIKRDDYNTYEEYVSALEKHKRSFETLLKKIKESRAGLDKLSSNYVMY